MDDKTLKYMKIRVKRAEELKTRILNLTTTIGQLINERIIRIEFVNSAQRTTKVECEGVDGEKLKAAIRPVFEEARNRFQDDLAEV